ncbi:MAG: gamma-glutamyltransferase [Micavibrio sp. TMED27]|nr:gamma-glutamyltransferase [Micavibrio sp.]OUT90815.1 MAG: gamma-glutamyltransferase [Micavibrio sp. TMED27]|tara:strand:- start:2273 stop:4021 length:1749 start_codon:yes stop_codon:yes gene_type:complete
MIFRHFFQISAFLAAISVASTINARAQERPAPEISTGFSKEQRIAKGEDFMVVSANPHATRAGYEILKRGGSAADAAIAVQAVLGLTEPQSSGFGGGAFVLYYDAKAKELKSYDARETAPGLASPFLFYKQGKPINFKEAVLGGKAVGVPGVPLLLSNLHEAHGKLTWMELFENAIKLADQGFHVSPRLAKMLEYSKDDLSLDKNASTYFKPAGTPVKAGDLLVNHAYRDMLKDYAFSGARPFYSGKFANAIIDKVQNIERSPGLLTAQDFENYKVITRDPICGPYRRYIICSMAEPSSGGLTILQILGLIEKFDLKALGAQNPKSWSIIAQASALAFADRAQYMADPDFVNTPSKALLNPDYINSRAMLITPDKPLKNVEAGTLIDWDGPLYERSADISKPSTTHISIIDKEGNIISMTSSIESAFGSHTMTHGFLLNNQLTDFSFNPFDKEQGLIANMVEGGKRPRSSMAPTIVFNHNGEPMLVIGSAGGSRIIGYVLQRIIGFVDWNKGAEELLSEKHILSRNAAHIDMETDLLAHDLKDLGFESNIRDLNSGLTAIEIRDDIYIGAADPRREGIALGQ